MPHFTHCNQIRHLISGSDCRLDASHHIVMIAGGISIGREDLTTHVPNDTLIEIAGLYGSGSTSVRVNHTWVITGHRMC